MKLRDVLPHEAVGGEFEGDRFLRYLDLEVIKEFDGRKFRWPGGQKNVVSWWILENKMAVGWNENCSTGWSFPIASKASLSKAGY